MTLLEASQLVKDLEETFGVSAAAAQSQPQRLAAVVVKRQPLRKRRQSLT